MTDRPTEGHIDQLVKARWLAIGLSQADLAEVLGGTFQQTPEDGNGSNCVDADRLMQVAKALGIPADLICPQTVGTEREGADLSPTQRMSSLQSMLALRLLRAFQDLTDPRTKEVLVQLVEQIVKRQTSRDGDAG
jgi:transcriptional regulator with XRE-family HTH domain